MTAPENASTPAEHRLTRVLGLREAVALGVGGTIGGGIFVLVGAAAGEAGPGALLSFGLAFLASLLIALPYAELACRFPLAGGGYAVAHAVLGRRWGFLMGWGYWGAYLAVSGYVTLGFGGYLDNLIGLPTAVGAVALVTSCTAVNLAGVRLSARVQALVVLLAAAALLGFGLLGLPHVELDRFTPAFPQGPSGVLTGALLAFLAFGGFDMVAAAGEEIAEPDRNLPLAILLTLVAVLGLYLLVAIVALGVLPWNQLGASSAPLSDAASEFAGGTGRTGVAVAALLTTAATANAVLVVTSRIAFAMARDGLLPSAVARVDPRTGATRVAILLSGALLAAVALAGSIDLAATTGGFLYVLHFIVPLAALILLRRRDPSRPAFRTPLPALVLPIALAASLALLLASGRTGILLGCAWLAVGLAAHAAITRRSRHPNTIDRSHND
ncbi:MAG: APC family permease [Thermomicrobiales bacterium]